MSIPIVCGANARVSGMEQEAVHAQVMLRVLLVCAEVLQDVCQTTFIGGKRFPARILPVHVGVVGARVVGDDRVAILPHGNGVPFFKLRILRASSAGDNLNAWVRWRDGEAGLLCEGNGGGGDGGCQ